MFLESFTGFHCAKISLPPRLDVLWTDETGCVRSKVTSQEIRSEDEDHKYGFAEEQEVLFVSFLTRVGE